MLDISNGGGDFTPYIKYNAKAGRWYTKIDDNEVEVNNPTFVIDFDNIKTGWLFFKSGQAPEKVFDPHLGERAPKPDRTYVDDKGKTRDCFSRGFQVEVFSDKSIGGLRELSSTSQAMSSAINPLYVQYEKEKPANAGKLPVVNVTGVKAETNDYGTNYSPIMAIEKWVDRPAAFDEDSSAAEVSPEAAFDEDSGAAEVSPEAPVAVVDAVSEF